LCPTLIKNWLPKSLAPADFAEPFVWFRLGLSEEDQTKTDLVKIIGAGASFNVLDPFVAADERVMVVVPEPTAIEKTLWFLISHPECGFANEIRSRSR